MDALVKIVSDIFDGLDNGEHVALLLCDLSKTFDSVKHMILLDEIDKKVTCMVHR